MVSGTGTIWSQQLAEGTSAQQPELVALAKALELAEGKRATIYTDSRYAFATAHVVWSVKGYYPQAFGGLICTLTYVTWQLGKALTLDGTYIIYTAGLIMISGYQKTMQACTTQSVDVESYRRCALQEIDFYVCPKGDQNGNSI